MTNEYTSKARKYLQGKNIIYNLLSFGNILNETIWKTMTTMPLLESDDIRQEAEGGRYEKKKKKNFDNQIWWYILWYNQNYKAQRKVITDNVLYKSQKMYSSFYWESRESALSQIRNSRFQKCSVHWTRKGNFFSWFLVNLVVLML